MSGHQPLSGMLSNSAHQYAFKNSIPWFVIIELTMNCNLLCSHCYNFDRSKPILPQKQQGKISTERILTLLEELKSAGTLMVSFSGGEALMSPDLFLYIKKARELNLLVTIKSNGTLITDELAKKLKEAEVYKIEISLYGSNSNEHDWLTQKSGSYLKTIEGIKNARNASIPVELSIVIHQKNYQSIQNMIDLASKLDCTHGLSLEITKRYDQTNPQGEIRVTKDQLEEIFKSKLGSHFSVQNTEKNLQCECARTVCGVASNGDIYPCIGAPIPSGNLLRKSFAEIWKNSEELNKIRNLTFNDFSECKECSLIDNCSRSSGGAFVNTNNYTGKNPSDCMEAELRKKLGL